MEIGSTLGMITWASLSGFATVHMDKTLWQAFANPYKALPQLFPSVLRKN
jgi:hypothetical protein